MRSRRIIGVLTALGIILALHPNISSAKPATGNAANEVVALESLRRVALISATLYPETSFRPTGITSAERDLASFERALAVRVRQAGGSVSQDNRLWHATTNAAPQVSALTLAESNLHLIARTVNFANPKDQQRIAQWIDDPALLLHLGPLSKFVIGSREALSAAWPDRYNVVSDRPFIGVEHSARVSYIARTDDFTANVGSDGTRVKLPLRGGLALWLYQPANANVVRVPGMAGVVSIRTIKLVPEHVRLFIPCFEVQQATSVRASLIDPSYTKTFNIWRLNPQAPIDAALQSAHIRVDRRGLSFSSTTVLHVLKSLERRTPQITIDHPFFFAVTDEQSQNILVAGKVAQLEPRADACVSATELISRRGNGGTATGQR